MTFDSFEDFWPFYVSQHLHPVSRGLHVVGTSLALVLIALSPLEPWLLLAAPATGYGMAWIGHFGFEGNKPATFGNPLWSLRGDLRMLRYTLTGRMAVELERHRDQGAEASVSTG